MNVFLAETEYTLVKGDHCTVPRIATIFTSDNRRIVFILHLVKIVNISQLMATNIQTLRR